MTTPMQNEVLKAIEATVVATVAKEINELREEVHKRLERAIAVIGKKDITSEEAQQAIKWAWTRGDAFGVGDASKAPGWLLDWTREEVVKRLAARAVPPKPNPDACMVAPESETLKIKDPDRYDAIIQRREADGSWYGLDKGDGRWYVLHDDGARTSVTRSIRVDGLNAILRSPGRRGA